MEAGEHVLTRGTCFVARRLEVVVVAAFCGFRGVFWVRRDFFVLFFPFFFLRTHTACCQYESSSPHLPLY